MIEPVSGLSFWIALGQILAVNLALSGDNGVVIALAAHSLPAQRRRSAIVWGSVAAIAVRMILTVAAFEVLRLPYMKIVGSAVLLWIAVQLLARDARKEEGASRRHSFFASAGYVIMIANLAMSLDNVLAIAAAAADDKIMLAVGLVISAAIIGFGGTWVRVLVSRFPAVYTLCAALIGYLAGGMLVNDVVGRHWIHEHLFWLQDVSLGPLDVSVAGLLGAVSVFSLARLQGVLTGPRRRQEADASEDIPGTEIVRARFGAFGAWVSHSRILTLLPFAIVVAVTYLGHPLYMHFQHRLRPQVSYYDLKLGMPQDEVVHIKGQPEYVVDTSKRRHAPVAIRREDIPANKTAKDYPEWEFPIGRKEPGTLEVVFDGKTKQVAEIGCYSQSGYCAPVFGISTGAAEADVVRKLGAPHDVRLNKGSETFNYPALDLSLLLENKKVSMLRVHRFEKAGS